MNDDVLIARRLSKSFGGASVVNEIDLVLRQGEIMCLLGPSGCGKTTLIRLLAGLERPDSGAMMSAGRTLAGPGVFVPPERRGIGLVFQDVALFPHLTAAENVAFGLRAMDLAERRERALALLRRFQLAHRADAYPHTLSGGEQQRVGIARALAPAPSALLLDEPFSGLDGPLRAELRERVIAGLRESDTAILIVTHDPEEAMLLGDRLALMNAGQIVQVGSPEECYARPASDAAAALLGPINLVPAAIRGGLATCLLGQLAARGLPDGPAFVLVRPEQLTLDQGSGAYVRSVRFAGSEREVMVESGGEMLLLRVPLPFGVPEGEVGLRLVGDPHILPA